MIFSTEIFKRQIANQSTIDRICEKGFLPHDRWASLLASADKNTLMRDLLDLGPFEKEYAGRLALAANGWLNVTHIEKAIRPFLPGQTRRFIDVGGNGLRAIQRMKTHPNERALTVIYSPLDAILTIPPYSEKDPEQHTFVIEDAVAAFGRLHQDRYQICDTDVELSCLNVETKSPLSPDEVLRKRPELPQILARDKLKRGVDYVDAELAEYDLIASICPCLGRGSQLEVLEKRNALVFFKAVLDQIASQFGIVIKIQDGIELNQIIEESRTIFPSIVRSRDGSFSILRIRKM